MRQRSEASFWGRMEQSGECLIWRGGLAGNGYGDTSWHGRRWSTHRLAWTLTNGPIPDRMQVLHRCDNPPCCRPDHLFLGTQSANVKDMYAKGRGTGFGLRNSGIRHPKAKLTEDQVREIRRLSAEGASTRSLAPRFGIAYQTVFQIVARKTWRSVP